MSNETQKAVDSAKEVQTEIFKAKGMQIRQHEFGDIVVINSDLVPAKLIDILMASLDDSGYDVNGHGVFSIVFRDDGYPMDDATVMNSWAFSIDACSAMCNIQHCIELAFQDTLNPEHVHTEKASIHMAVWKNMLKGFFHETWHSQTAIIEPYKIRFDDEYRAGDEDEAIEFATGQLFRMAKTMDIEPVWNDKIKAMIDNRLECELHRIEESDEATKADKAWAFHQKYLLEKGGMFYAPPEGKDEEGVHLMTFKEYLNFFSDDPDSDEWKTETIGVQGEAVYTLVDETADGTPAVNTAGVVQGQGQGVWVDAEADPGDDFDNGEAFEPDFEPVLPGGVPGFQGVQTQVAIQPEAGAQVVQPTYQQPAPQGGGYGQPAQQGGGYGQPTGYGTATTNTPASVQVGAQQYPAINMDTNTAQAVITNLYLKMFRHIMQTCGFQFGQVAPGQDTSALLPFSQKDNIKAHLALDENEMLFVKEFKLENTGNFVKCEGAIQGFFSDKLGKLPTYEIKMQNLDGSVCTRRVFPQNPFKPSDWKNPAAGFTPRALEAQQGKQILWIFNPDTKQYTYVVENGTVNKL